MPSFSQPDFKERISLAAEARQKALDKLRAKPPVDEAVLAERRAAHAARVEAEAQAREAKRLAREQEKAEKLALQREAAELAERAKPVPLTDAEKKAARDARYAARKANKSR
jgi:hypothetical protein